MLKLSVGAAEDMAHSSLRFGIGRFTTEDEIDFVVAHIIKTVHKLRDMRSVFTFSPDFCRLSDPFFFLARYGKWFRKELILTLLTGPNTSPSPSVLSL